ncbi:sugar ABC transporter substrate-binding protein [Actinotalea sp. BY-33]|uniref:Sugar ABC transporter substrate-binding protein n=1 Tax=Actinotalea soli TaxID=2819234 RepID=A0A939LQG9_9CELL|nr:sugar ABC transporter substrate-binding protein [Actinotalea soli]MBO1752128.1 sugar ABC transporter substrate-binding protein [Actinotalea soli]
MSIYRARPRTPFTRRIAAGTVGAVLAVTVLAACSGGDDEPSGTGDGAAAGGETTIRYAFWGVPEEVEVQEQLKAAFEAEHPEITVELDHVSDAGAFGANMLTQIAGGNAPDVFYVGEALVSSFGQRGVLEDLMPYIERDGVDLEAYIDGTVQPLVTPENEMFAFPKDNTPMMVYYNKRLFDEAGVEYPSDDWTWEEMRTAAEQLTVREGNQVRQYGIDYGAGWTTYMPTVYSNGGTLFNEDRTASTYADPATAEAVQAIADLWLTEPAVAPSPDAFAEMGLNGTDLFLSGRLAMQLNGRWNAFFIRDLEDEWGVAPMPSLEEGKTTSLFVTLAVPENSQNKDAAWEFVKFVVSEEGQRINSPTGLGLPVLESLVEDGPSWLLEGESEDNAAVYLDSLTNRVEPLPFHPQWSETVDEIAVRELDAVWRGESTAAEAGERIDQQIEAVLGG